MKTTVLIALVLSMAATVASADTIFTASSSGVNYCVNDSGFFVQSGGITTANAQAGVNGGNFHLYAKQPAGDVGVVLYFDGSLKLGDLQSVSVAGTMPVNVNLWFDTTPDGAFFTFDSNHALTALNGDTYCSSQPIIGGSSLLNGSTSFYMMNGPKGGSTLTLDQLKGGAVSNINLNTPVALWVGFNSTTAGASADIANITVVPEPATLSILGLGLFGRIRRRNSK